MDKSIGIYIHIPFCKQKCNYCDFNSYSGREYLAGPYFDALFSEIRLRACEIGRRPVRSVFIGGGTPSLVEPRYIASLLELCSKLFQMNHDVEISLESNPGTLSYEALKVYREAGVNRLSIGLQAWQDKLLKELGRIHDRQQFEENFKAAVQAGFQNINVDLIFGLPGQNFEDWTETLEAVTLLGSSAPGALSHMSCYSLKIEEGTVFGDMYDAGKLKPADDELDRKMYCYAVEFLGNKGFRQYEISNFAKPGYECRHNLIYWKALEYAGYGAGAHSYLNGKRFGNVAGIEQYITAVDKVGVEHAKNLSGTYSSILKECRSPEGAAEAGVHEDIQLIGRQEAMSEYMILGLRLNEGISSAEFEERFGDSLQAVYGDKLERLVERGLLEKGEKVLPERGIRYRLTAKGLDLANQVFVEFLG